MKTFHVCQWEGQSTIAEQRERVQSMPFEVMTQSPLASLGQVGEKMQPFYDSRFLNSVQVATGSQQPTAMGKKDNGDMGIKLNRLSTWCTATLNHIACRHSVRRKGFGLLRIEMLYSRLQMINLWMGRVPAEYRMYLTNFIRRKLVGLVWEYDVAFTWFTLF